MTAFGPSINAEHQVNLRMGDDFALRAALDLRCDRQAAALAQSGHYDKAARICLQTAQQSQGANPYFNASLCFCLAGMFSEAIAPMERALSIDSGLGSAHILIGVAYWHLGLVGRAATHWWHANQVQPCGLAMTLWHRFVGDGSHPERLALFPLCKGRGIDVGCGNRKTHPGAIGVDVVPGGENGRYGSAAGKASQADIVASGDALEMFADGELDYVVQRHNLEHYQDVVLALEEWKRIVRFGGVIGMVVPDDETCDTIKLDPTHKHVFTKESLRRLIHLISGLRIVYLETLLLNWSFVCILQKTETRPQSQVGRLDYQGMVKGFESEQILDQAYDYAKQGHQGLCYQCVDYLRSWGQGSGTAAVHECRMVTVSGRSVAFQDANG